MNKSLLNILTAGFDRANLDPSDPAGWPALFESSLLDLMATARLKTSTSPLEPFTCGIVNIKSGHCREDCAFCTQSVHYNTNTLRYPLLSLEDILPHAERAAANGINYLGLVASGRELADRDFEAVLATAEELKSRFGLGLCASLGLLTPARAQALKKVGFSSYHHNLETSPGFFKQICSTHSFQDRIDTVKAAKTAGLRLCSGGIFGLGETWADRLELAGLLAELEVDSIPINFLVPMTGTPLAHNSVLKAAEALRLIAIFRLLNPHRDLVICGGREKVLGDLKSLCFCAGANGLMVGDYLTIKGSTLEEDLSTMAVLGLRGPLK